MRRAIPNWAIWLGGALAWVAGVAFALFALAAPAKAELAFTAERARLACAGAAPEALPTRGNALVVPPRSAAQLRDCRLDIDFAVRDPALAAAAAASGHVELLGLGLARAGFPAHFAVNREGIALAVRPGGLTLALAADRLFAGERVNGAALVLGWRSEGGAEADSFISPTLLIERADRRSRRTGN